MEFGLVWHDAKVVAELDELGALAARLEQSVHAEHARVRAHLDAAYVASGGHRADARQLHNQAARLCSGAEDLKCVVQSVDVKRDVVPNDNAAVGVVLHEHVHELREHFGRLESIALPDLLGDAVDLLGAVRDARAPVRMGVGRETQYAVKNRELLAAVRHVLVEQLHDRGPDLGRDARGLGVEADVGRHPAHAPGV